MAKTKPASKPAATSIAPGPFPLPLLAGEKQINRSASKALLAAYTSITGIVATLTTPEARKDFGASMTSWWNRTNAELAGTTAKPAGKQGVKMKSAA